MKKFNLLLLISLILFSSSAISQRYRTAADTLKLNEEYNKVSAAIVDLNAQLTSAQNNLPGYRNRADKAVANAEASAQNNRNRASDASGDNVKDAKRAKREARRALNNAKQASNANKKEESQDRKIENLKTEIQRKQDRLQQLDNMRNEIRNKQ